MSKTIYDVAIAGGGPAGTSAAIHLAQAGFSVLLVEQKKFPRAKLCGEFISPECITHFAQLGVAEEILEAGGARLIETNFYSRSGHKVTVPTHWFANHHAAIGLSRAEMDQKLLERAKQIGVNVLEETPVAGPTFDSRGVSGICVKSKQGLEEHRSRLTIDATGRARILARKIDKRANGAHRASLIAFKAHLQGDRAATGACEIYFYPGGYGGLNNIEGGSSNLCFIASARDVQGCGSDPTLIMKSTVMRNSRAAYTLAEAEFVTDWLSVALESFGGHQLVPASRLLMIGDAAAFIDPFTGSGMLMALESGAVAAQTIIEFRDELENESSFTELADRYRSNYSRTFNARLRVSAWLRRAAFVPRLAETAIVCFGFSDAIRRRVARATRRSSDLSTTTIPQITHDVKLKQV